MYGLDKWIREGSNNSRVMKMKDVNTQLVVSLFELSD
jgi:hypothetical protein